ncbi:hypothetical protein ATJ97_1542 [Georgenia soli]|uniref:Uncharacterized protein n=1 Tax=Georgenia soli TaxID=638953 RepID=A0A2A9EIZ2_9MICO|nr:hypothetical protein [Georgenia soli]PFG39047.1 hypothetical protein ATJ97_1542 [Georgenia soli]
MRGLRLVLRRGWHALTNGFPVDEPHECMYGNTPGALENCTVIVPPGQGWRRGRRVFCSAEHAVRDRREEQI